MASSAWELILQHSENVVQNPESRSHTDKSWARPYPPLQSFYVHTTVDDEQGLVHAAFDPAFLPLGADEEKRSPRPAYPPNERGFGDWRPKLMWSTGGIARYPTLSSRHGQDIQPSAQTCHTKPLGEVNIAENVDCTYAVHIGNQRVPVAIGEMKRNLINSREWQTGHLSEPQQRLGRELRGYADKYQCPQVFCWDVRVLLLLQFRASEPEDIRAADCPVDCWVIPVAGSTCTLRYALYRLMVQGLRRCQAALATNRSLTVGSLTEYKREFFTGCPIWRGVDGQSHADHNHHHHPEGYVRSVHAATGRLYWGQERELLGGIVWETDAFWEQ